MDNNKIEIESDETTTTTTTKTENGSNSSNGSSKVIKKAKKVIKKPSPPLIEKKKSSKDGSNNSSGGGGGGGSSNNNNNNIDYKQWHTEWPIKVFKHPINGRYLVATRDIEELTVILRDLPYTWAVDHASCDTVCQHCFLEVPLDQQILPTDFYMCEGCSRVGYCSAKCKQIDYSQHRFECQIFKELDTEEYSPFLMSEIKLLVRTLSRKWLEDSIDQTAGVSSIDDSEKEIKRSNTYSQYKNPLSLIPQDNGLRYNDYAELVSNVENYNESLKESLSYWICKYVVKLAAKLGKIENEFDLLNILLRNRCNAFYIQGRPRDGSPGESRGCGVYVRNSFFNHSCDPNVNYWVVNNTLEVECSLLKNVKEGEELTISYIDSAHTIDKRREKLLEGYLFHCLCNKCKEDELLPLEQTGTSKSDLKKDDEDDEEEEQEKEEDNDKSKNSEDDEEEEQEEEDDDEVDDDIHNKNDKKLSYKTDEDQEFKNASDEEAISGDEDSN